MLQAVSVIGAIIILAASAANQCRLIGPSHLAYAALNFAGSALLAAVASIERQLGFLLLEGVWALVSLWSVYRILRGDRTAPGAR
jgi:hypothetical protein